MKPAIESVDARNKLEDLSGIEIKPGENPYDALIQACKDEPVGASVDALIPRHGKTASIRSPTHPSARYV